MRDFFDPNAEGVDPTYVEVQQWVTRRDNLRAEIASAKERVAASRPAVEAALERVDRERDMATAIDARILEVENELDDLAWAEPIMKAGEVIPAAAKISVRLTALREARRAQDDAIRQARQVYGRVHGATAASEVFLGDADARLQAIENQLDSYGFLRRVPQTWANKIAGLLDRAGVE